jgi:hypothetical protein
LALIGFAAAAVIALAVVSRFEHQRAADIRLCMLIQVEWQQIHRLAVKDGLTLPAPPPQCR